MEIWDTSLYPIEIFIYKEGFTPGITVIIIISSTAAVPVFSGS